MITENNQLPAFSIVIPTLNEELALPNLLNDLAAQTFPDFEVIVVDGRSEDKTSLKAEAFKTKFKHLSIIFSDKRNVSYQRNLGAKSSLSDWLVFMDADNRVPPYFLQGIKFRVEMLKPDILSTWFEPDSVNKKDKAAALLANLYMDLQKTSDKPSILEAFLCINKQSFLKIKGFNENIHWGEGSDLLHRAIHKRMKFYFVKEPRYTFSFRRLRKQGTMDMFRKFAELELNRLVGTKIPPERKKHLYPMEGGTYFEISAKERNRIEKIFLKLISNTQNKIENGNNGLVRYLFKKIFPQNKTGKPSQKRYESQSLPK